MHNRLQHLAILFAIAALCGCDSNNEPADGGDAGDPPDGAPVVARCDGTPDGTCPCHITDHGSTRYLVCPDTTTWEEARDDCRRFGFELLRIDDAEEQDFVWTEAAGGEGDYWIGLNDQDTEGTYVWSDGTPLGSFAHWAPAAPNNGDGEVEEDCVEMIEGEDGHWNDRDCESDYLDYICEGHI